MDLHTSVYKRYERGVYMAHAYDAPYVPRRRTQPVLSREMLDRQIEECALGLYSLQIREQMGDDFEDTAQSDVASAARLRELRTDEQARRDVAEQEENRQYERRRAGAEERHRLALALHVTARHWHEFARTTREWAEWRAREPEEQRRCAMAMALHPRLGPRLACLSELPSELLERILVPARPPRPPAPRGLEHVSEATVDRVVALRETVRNYIVDHHVAESCRDRQERLNSEAV